MLVSHRRPVIRVWAHDQLHQTRGQSIHFVQYAHVERGRSGAFLLVTAHMQVVVAVTPVGQSVNQPGIAVERKDDRPVGGEQCIKIVIRKAVRVFARWLQLHEIDDVDDAHFEIGCVSSEQVNRGKGLEGWNVPTTSHHNIGFATPVVAGPLPNSKSRFAVLDRFVHRQPLRRGLFPRRRH